MAAPPSTCLRLPMKTIASLRFLALLFAASLTACQTTAPRNAANKEPLRAIDRPIDLNRFMGKWYVLAHIPTFIEKNAYNGVESYRLAADGTIPTTYVFNEGGFDGPVKTYRPLGFVENQKTKAQWWMQFVWPFKATYLIVYLDKNYETTIIGVPNRNYAWIMARTKTLPEADYNKLVAWLAESGHDITKLRRIPHR